MFAYPFQVRLKSLIDWRQSVLLFVDARTGWKPVCLAFLSDMPIAQSKRSSCVVGT